MDREVCIQLLELFGSHECLWNTKHHNFRNKNVRDEAWKLISEKMELPVKDLKKKMESLMGSYRSERSRAKKRTSTGSTDDDTYKSNWYAYPYFDFMANRNSAGSIIDTLCSIENKDVKIKSSQLGGGESECGKSNADEETPIVYISPFKQIEPRKIPKKRKFQPEKEKEKKSQATETSVRTPDMMNDPYDTFGKHVANELRKYDDITHSLVKRDILNIIFEANMGQYRQHAKSYFQKQQIDNPPLPSTALPNKVESAVIPTSSDTHTASPDN